MMPSRLWNSRERRILTISEEIFHCRCSTPKYALTHVVECLRERKATGRLGDGNLRLIRDLVGKKYFPRVGMPEHEDAFVAEFSEELELMVRLSREGIV